MPRKNTRRRTPETNKQGVVPVISSKVTPALKLKLEEAAVERGSSLSEEIRRRLDESFQADAYIAHANANLARLLAAFDGLKEVSSEQGRILDSAMSRLGLTESHRDDRADGISPLGETPAGHHTR